MLQMGCWLLPYSPSSALPLPPPCFSVAPVRAVPCLAGWLLPAEPFPTAAVLSACSAEQLTAQLQQKLAFPNLSESGQFVRLNSQLRFSVSCFGDGPGLQVL